MPKKPTEHSQQRYLDIFRNLMPMHIADKNIIRCETKNGEKLAAWLNSHAAIFQKLKEDSPIIGESGKNDIKDISDDDAEYLTKTINAVIKDIYSDKEKNTFVLGMKDILREAKEDGYRLNRANARDCIYRIRIKGAFYNLTFLDVFCHIAGTTMLLCEQKTGPYKNLILYPIKNEEIQKDMFMFQQEAWPKQKKAPVKGKTYIFTTVPSEEDEM